MKKLISILALTTTISSANAMEVIHNIGRPRPAGNYQYELGYNSGKHHAYHTIATAAVMVGIIAFAGMAIYQYNEQSRWGVNQNGIIYKF